MNDKMKNILRCIKNSSNKEYLELSVNLLKDPMFIKFEEYGLLNKDKNILLIKSLGEKQGFFAEYRRILDAFVYAERFHLEPVVWYDKKFLYSEEQLVLNTDNAFEYYFKQPAGVTLEETLKSYNVAYFYDCHRKIAEQLSAGVDGYQISDDYIEQLSRMSKKYIHLNETTEQYIQNGLDSLGILKHSTLGVHVRGTDFRAAESNHPIPVSAEEFLNQVMDILKNKHFEQVFLATDDINTIKIFEKGLGSKLVYYKDVYRSDTDVSVAFSDDKRKNHHYILGLEVLRDMISLSFCDGLIAGISQVSICARITKRSREQNYAYIKILDKGIHKEDWSK